ncbi:fatty acyl-AMP ligase [Streptomyces sp. NL15-2K]|uniref:fatty acyl-AMP ligase n=1 Tax=Streptomyces sp. NL15-2K TaxID=376149 RepID=UPI000F57F1CA|nr:MULTISPECIES: fatty acyl-AMP ligase [Actinomycetes]WKX06872.1 fatty acyl-AMP ligase [Kutzneria buriramensis]GCB44042.1 non-ribosomal peptide synthetase [Streptomyces sp. NL15-2K]
MAHDLTDAPDLVTLFREHVAARPDAEAVAFLADPSDLAGGLVRWSYARLDREARIRAAWLREHLPPGSRVLLLHPSGLEFVAAFVGCLYAGMIAVPAPLPGGQRHQRKRLAAIAHDAGTGAVLTTATDLAEVREWAAELPDATIPVVAGDLLGAGDPENWRPLPMDRSTTAVLQYTSGSTGDPKGVVLQHDHILVNTAAATSALAFGGRVGGWLPHFHDMGLFTQIVWPLLLGGSTVLMAPAAFVRRPIRWLRMIDAYGVGCSFAPNFAFELCTRRVGDEDLAGLDLSRWHLAGCGSEPINPRALRAFSDKFAAAGFRPEAVTACYGMAETTVYISGHADAPLTTRRVDLDALARGEFTPAVEGRVSREIVACGRPQDAYDVRIVDPETGQELPDGRMGEIWLRGRSISPGYWQRDDSAAVFDAVTSSGDGGYLRTGDLGVFYDGEVYVHGRLKDLIIVHGRNVYPQDIEHELRAQHPELGRTGVVFAGPGTVPGDDGSAVVVTHEVAGVPDDRLPALAAEIRHTVGREFGISVATVALVKPGTVLRTTSGKIRRSAMRDLFHEGRLASLHQDPR